MNDILGSNKMQHAIRVMKPWTCLKSFSAIDLSQKIFWPPRSPDLTIPDFFPWGYLKGKVYEGNPQTIDNLKISIIQRIQEITPSMLKRASKNMCKRVQLCLQERGGHFEHLS